MTAANPVFVPPTTTQNSLLKLESGNYTSWVTQINPILRTYDLMAIVDGSEPCPPQSITDEKGKTSPNPEYTNWNKKDQFLLSIITASLSEKVLSTVYGLNTSQQAWTALATKFASKSKSRIANLKKQLQNMSQGPKSCFDYIQAVKNLADQLGVAGNPIPEEEIISSILNGLNSSFTHFITTYSFHTRVNEISFEDFQDELLNHEMLLQQHHTPIPDQSTFALTAYNPIPSQFSKGRPYMPSRFSPRNFSPRQGNNFTSPRPFGRGPPQYSRGFNQHQRGNFSFPNQQYNKGTSQTNSYPTRQSNSSNNYQPR
jgi:hypothetical protein